MASGTTMCTVFPADLICRVRPHDHEDCAQQVGSARRAPVARTMGPWDGQHLHLRRTCFAVAMASCTFVSMYMSDAPL